MAVEARHGCYPARPLVNLRNRGMIMNGVEGNGSMFDNQLAYGVVTPLSGGLATAMDKAVPEYGSTSTGFVQAENAAVKPGDFLVPLSRKRLREATDPPPVSLFPNILQNQIESNGGSFHYYLGEDTSLQSQIQWQQSEIDRFVSVHTEKLRTAAEERRRRCAVRIADAAEASLMKKLQAKEEELKRLRKLNKALEERVKSMTTENQMWIDFAQTNHAAANSLRFDLDQALAQVHGQQHRNNGADDSQSFCGSNYELEEIESIPSTNDWSNLSRDSKCRSCRKEDACALLLPCRHLCLCTVCESSLGACPVCNSAKTASLHVNLSPSF